MTVTHLWADGRVVEVTGRGYDPVGVFSNKSTAQEWVVILVLATLPAIAEEITKFFLRRQDKAAAAA